MSAEGATLYSQQGESPSSADIGSGPTDFGNHRNTYKIHTGEAVMKSIYIVYESVSVLVSPSHSLLLRPLDLGASFLARW